MLPTKRAMFGIAAIAGTVLGSTACQGCASSVPEAISARLNARQGPPLTLANQAPSERLPPARAAHDGSAPRIVLNEQRRARLREAAKRGTPAWRTLRRRCDEFVAKPGSASYQAFVWADALASLAVCWHATGEDAYQEAAVGYLGALLDDRFEVGDRQGGDGVVQHDSGYGIRTFGAYSALGYDWLRAAPAMTPELKKKIVARLDAWLSWYDKDGYLNDEPIANYFWGYATTLSLAGLATRGETPEGERWLSRARALWSEKILPAFRYKLRGGGWPEGWQYGEYTAFEVAFVAEAFETAAGIPMVKKLPWLGEVVRYHTYALLPDEKSVYCGGTWGQHPCRPSALGLTAATLALDGVDDQRAAEARWLTHNALPPLEREHAWLALLAERPGAEERDPRRGAATSLHVPGQGLTFFRSDWSKSATFVPFQAGPRLTPDHQDKDQGHFELWRGGDGLLVDGGGNEGSATINHNTLLVDDGGRVLDYSPNQGVWGFGVRTTRVGDDGLVALASGDIADAYAPKCASEGCRDRAVEKLVRTLVYVRPSLLVIDDQVGVTAPDIRTTWAAHVTQAPTIRGDLASAVVGRSRVDVRTLEPRAAHVVARREPAGSGKGPHRLNQPWGPMWRLEVEAPRGERDRRFLNVVTANAADAAPPPATKVAGNGLRGALTQIDEDGNRERVAVLFADSEKGGSARLGAAADIVVVAGLLPGAGYAASVGPDCTLKVELKKDGRARAHASGFLRLSATRCQPR
jgi:hypothetical protein